MLNSLHAWVSLYFHRNNVDSQNELPIDEFYIEVQLHKGFS